MRKSLNIALASAAMALPVLAVSLPLTESFDSGMGEFTVEDANRDNITIKTLSLYGLGYTDGLQYAGSSTDPADDWLFTPVLGLRKGYVYELTYRYKVCSSGTTNRIEWKAGKEPASEAMSLTMADVREYVYNYGSWGEETVRIQVPEDGEYYIGMHIISDAGQGAIYFDQIELPEGINGAAPLAPEVGSPVFSVNGDALQASFNVTLPFSTVSGNDLSGNEIDVKVTRSDSDGAAVVKGQSGANVTYTDENASTSSVTYTFSCVADGAEGPAVTVTSSPRIGTPKAVENLNVEQDGNSFRLTWDPVTGPVTEGDIFIPAQVRYVVKCGTATVADGISEPNAEYIHPLPEEGQEAVSFSITAVVGNQQSAAVKSGIYMVGTPYVGEFNESFTNRSYDNRTWIVENDKNTAWQPSIGSSYSPVVDPQDNDGGLLQFYYTTQETLHIWSPVIDLTGLSNPKLKFWVYLQPTTSYDTEFQPGFLTGGEEKLIGEPIKIKSGEKAGWTEFIYDLPEETLQTETQLFFAGKGGTYGKIFIDNISIRSYLGHNLAVDAAAPARHLEIGDNVSFSAQVTNKGVSDEDDYKVILFADGEQVASVDGVMVNAMQSVTVDVPFKVLPKYAGTDVSFTLSVEMETDMDVSDNETEEIVIPVNENDLVKVDGLIAKADDDDACVFLNWDIPQISTEPTYAEVAESFEEWASGSTEPDGGWIFIDVDGVTQAGINNVNQGGIFAAMVAENFTAQYSWDPSLVSHDGTKCLAVTQAVSYYNTDTDNWIISPEIKGGTTVTFFTLMFSSYGSSENFDIMWSEGGVSADDFKLLTTASATKDSWKEVSFELPADAARFAIRVSGRHSYPLLFDSFSFTSKSEPAILSGFNVYRDHNLLCTLNAYKDSFIDDSPVNGVEHTYHVTALYDKGESGYSNGATALVNVDSSVGRLLDDSGDAQYYNLDGTRISTPAKGQIVIMRRGNNSAKILIN